MATFETYVTVEGDVVDLIAFNRFGFSDVSTEAIYEANPGLAELGPILPMGTTVKIPVPIERPTSTAQRLWD